MSEVDRSPSRPGDQAVQIALTLLREADPGCENYRNGYGGCDHIARHLAELNIDRFKPGERNTYHPETGDYRRCLSCQIGDLFEAIDAEQAPRQNGQETSRA